MERSHSEALFSMLDAISRMRKLELTTEIFKIWMMALDPYPFEDIRKAFNRFIVTESRMPMPADIIANIRGSERDLTLTALVKVETAVRRHGAYATVVFDDPGIHAAITGLGGWIRLCGLSEAELIWWRKEFRERYEHWAKTGAPEEEIPPFLPGLFELANMEAGYPPPPPALVGDREKCQIRLSGNVRTDDRVLSLMKSAFGQGALKEISR